MTAVEPSNAGGGEVIDLVEALRASVQQAKEKRAGQGQRSQPAQKKVAESTEPAKRGSPGQAKTGQSGRPGTDKTETGTGNSRRRTRKPA